MAIPLERARELVLAAAVPLALEVVPIGRAAGRVLGSEVRARGDSPAQASSAMDGYAVTAGPAGRTLRLVGESRAGRPSPVGVDGQTAVRIATGGVLPPGGEAVVPQERARVAGGLVALSAPAARGWNVRRPGEDMRAGAVVLAAGTRLGAAELAAAIGAGHGELTCHRRPRAVLLSTGDELRDPGSPLGPGEIHDANGVALAALASAAGAEVVGGGRIEDDPAGIDRALERALADADVLIVSGGMSVGRHDHVKAALGRLGAEEFFWGVKLRPGRPTWFGRRGEALVLGLPGNPVAAIVAFILLGRPLLAALLGARPALLAERARLESAVVGHPDRTEVVRVRLRAVDGQGLQAQTAGSPASHLTTALLGFDGLALIPAGGDELAAGSDVEIARLW